MSRIPITLKLRNFEGPLDLLLHLIQTNELDITHVSIQAVTDQYLTYIRLMQELNFDLASEFLVLAATLLHWKSKTLLPEYNQNKDSLEAEEAELSPEDLIRQLQELQRIRAAAEDMAKRPKLNEDFFFRANPRPPVHKIWREMNLSMLTVGYQDCIIRARKRSRILKKETVSLTEKIREFAFKLAPGQLTDLRHFIADNGSRPETVITFLASLEMAKHDKMKLYQQNTFDTIYIELTSPLTEKDLLGIDPSSLQMKKTESSEQEPQPELPLESPDHETGATS